MELLKGNAETIPLPEASIDVDTSHGVLNLVPDKPKALAIRELDHLSNSADAETREMAAQYGAKTLVIEGGKPS